MFEFALESGTPNPAESLGEVQDFLSVVENALRRAGKSARSVSLKSGYGPGAIRDMRSGRVPSAERLRAVCDALGLELAIRNPRSNDDLTLSRDQLRRLRDTLRDLTELVEELDEVSPTRSESPVD